MIRICALCHIKLCLGFTAVYLDPWIKCIYTATVQRVKDPFQSLTDKFRLNFFFLRAQTPNGSLGMGLLLQSHDGSPYLLAARVWCLAENWGPVRCSSIVPARLQGLSSFTKFARFNDDMESRHAVFSLKLRCNFESENHLKSTLNSG